MIRIHASLAASLLLCATAVTSVAQAQSGPASLPVAKLASADSAFLQQAAQSGQAEIEGSTLALAKATSPEVKAFAQKMVDEHTLVGKELNALAAAKGVKVPESPSPVQQAKLKLLSARQGASFDKRYADSLGLQAHKETVALFQKAADEARDPDVKAFATKTLPSLQHHLDMSRDLYARVHLGDKKKP